MPLVETTVLGTTSRSIKTIPPERLRTAVMIAAERMLAEIDRLERNLTEYRDAPLRDPGLLNPNLAAAYSRGRDQSIERISNQLYGVRFAASALSGALLLGEWENLRAWLQP